MPNRIDMIRLTSCRGATNDVTIPIEPAKPVVLVFGENGTGKSTIIDALDMVCNAKCGSIDGRSFTSVAAHVPSLGSAARDFRAEISISGKTWTTTFKGSKLSVSGPSPRPVAHILRRNQLLRLVEAAPADRYREIARFVDVTPIEKCEQELKDAARSAGVHLQTEIRVKQEAEDALRNLWVSEGSPGGAESGEVR